MNHRRYTSLGLIALLAIACSKPKEGTAEGQSTSAPSAATSSAPPAAGATVAAAQAEPSVKPPASFDGGSKETVESAVGLGCETRSLNGWLEVLCRKRNGTGGNPVAAFRIPTGTPEEIAKAELDSEGSEETPAFEKGENGELRMVLPFSAGKKDLLRVDWTDVSYLLKIEGASARFDWAANSPELRKACATLTEESKTVLKNAQKPGSPDGVSAGEVGKVNRFGVCQPAGRGAWVLALKSVKGSGEGTTRRITTELELVRVDDLGGRISTPLATFTTPPAALALGRLSAYDYNGDGRNEALFNYEILSGPSTVEPPSPKLLWSFTDSTIVPYEHSLHAGADGAYVEQLDPDMRPDLGSASPFVAFLDSDCGAKKCPPRLSGPKFFAHSLPNGEFSKDDEAARSALKRACGKKLETPIAVGGTGVNLERTAVNLACSRAYGISSETLTQQLEASRAKLCAEPANCKALETLLAWSKLDAPTRLH